MNTFILLSILVGLSTAPPHAICPSLYPAYTSTLPCPAPLPSLLPLAKTVQSIPFLNFSSAL